MANVEVYEPKKRTGRTVFIIILILIIIGLAGFVLYDKVFKKSLQPASAVPSPVPSVVTEATPVSNKIIDEGITWVEAQKVSDLGLFKKVTGEEGQELLGEYTKTDYYRVGKTSTGGDVILAEVQITGMGASNALHRFIKKGDEYTFIARNSDDIDYQIYTPDKNFKTDTDFVFKSLLPERVIVKGSTELVYQGNYGPSMKGGSDQKKITETRWGSLLMMIGNDIEKSDGKAKVATYYIKLNDSTKAYFEPRPDFLRDDGTFNAKWQVEKGKDIVFEKMKTDGCGLGGGSFPLVYNEKELDLKKDLATSERGSKLYYFDSADSELNKFGYDVYKMDGAENKKPIEDFVSDLGIIFWTDDYSNTIIFSNAKYEPQAECGKPVVYLYPTKETAVTVKVGAQMTKSEPAYQDGWKVLAYPDGKLQLAGKTYPYLFWEGLGRGVYPAVQAGTVIERNEAEKTIQDHLNQLGLNKQETADFLDFWMERMPSEPYLRLTWFTNEELDRLAPLQISPKPDSVIRVFLDFEGLKQKINLPSQELKTMARNGFTAVEWGGLLKK